MKANGHDHDDEFHLTAAWATKRTSRIPMETQDRYQAAWLAMLRSRFDESMPFLARIVYLRQRALGGIIDAATHGGGARIVRNLEYRRAKSPACEVEEDPPSFWAYWRKPPLATLQSVDPWPDRCVEDGDFAEWMSSLPEPDRSIAEGVVAGSSPREAALEAGLSSFHAERAVARLRRILEARRRDYLREIQRDSAAGAHG